MSPTLLASSSGLEADLFRLYRDYLDRAEKKRRWSLRDDIPWSECNPDLNPAVADVVESFLAVEMQLPDYVASAMTRARSSRACSWLTSAGFRARPTITPMATLSISSQL